MRLFIRRHIITQLAEEETAERGAHGERELVAYNSGFYLCHWLDKYCTSVLRCLSSTHSLHTQQA